jgi:hypothetical protein
MCIKPSNKRDSRTGSVRRFVTVVIGGFTPAPGYGHAVLTLMLRVSRAGRTPDAA